jgi:hypothetical protein
MGCRIQKSEKVHVRQRNELGSASILESRWARMVSGLAGLDLSLVMGGLSLVMGEDGFEVGEGEDRFEGD